MKIKLHYFIVSLCLLTCISCSNDDNLPGEDFVVAFKNSTENFSTENLQQEITLVFSIEAPQNGIINLTYVAHELSYGEDADFTTTPVAIEGTIELPFEAGTTGTSFMLHKNEIQTGEAPNAKIEFTITNVSITDAYTQGNSSLEISNNALSGGSITPNVGGPNQPNQVYIDLSTREETSVRRDQWDLAFYNGDAFRVRLNESLYMMAAPLATTNIDEITEEDVEELQPQMAFLIGGSDVYVDDPSGNIQQTAISEISSTPSENNVYLVDMGASVGTETPEIGSVAVSGEARGWMKIRILQEAGNYILQYATLNATTHHEVIIPKQEGFNFTFFSLTTGNTVVIEPQKDLWDLNFTVATEVLDLPEGGQSAYGFADYVSTNTLGNVKAYQVNVEDGIGYASFSLNNIQENLFQLDQRVIGANWRSVFDGLYADRFYVIKDHEDNYYKLKFTAMTNENGQRGYPEFEYKLLN